jgi:hypothetical protein
MPSNLEAPAARPLRARERLGLGAALLWVLTGIACTAGAAGSSPAPLRAPSPAAPLSPPSAAAASADGYQLPARGEGAGASFPFQPPAAVAADTRLARLSHSQLRHTVSDLLGIRELLASTLAPDASNGFGFDTSTAYRVDPRLGPQYRAMAEELAARVAADAAVTAHLAPCVRDTPVCRDRFLAAFGERAFRRPLSRDDLDTFQAVFDAGARRYQGQSAFRDGVRAVVEAMLQAPEFLYRVEASRSVDSMGRIRLDDSAR